MVLSPKINSYITRVHRLLLNSFPYLVVFSYGMLSIEAYTYIGALKKYIIADSRVFLYLTVMIGTYISVISISSNKMYKYIENTFIINSLLTPVLIFAYYYFLMAEAIHYPNYIFTTYHIQPSNIINIIYLNISLLLSLWIFKNQKIKLTIQKYISYMLPSSFVKNNETFSPIAKISKYLEIILITVMVFLLSNYLLTNITSTFAKISTDLVFIVNNPKLNYDQKMEKAWGKMYYYFLYVNKTIPEDAVIGLPPAQHRWLRTGNTVLMRYFLFPRNLVNLKETWKEETLNELPIENYDYLLMIPGDWNDTSVPEGWPKQFVSADYIEYYSPSTNTSERVYIDFDPSLEINQKSWGIIKVKNNNI